MSRAKMNMRKMKYLNKCTARFLIAVPAVLAAVDSCDLIGLGSEGSKGELRLAFSPGQECLTRSGLEIPDTSDFLLTVTDSGGKIVYDGKYGDSPEALSLDPDTYTVKVISEEFSKPKFSSPQFGDEQCVVVPAGKSVDMKLVCRQVNSGVRLLIDSAFLEAFPNGVLMLKSALGRLVYGYREKDIAYFKPGEVSLVLNEGKTDKLLMTRELKAQEILELKVNVAASAGSSSGGGTWNMSIQIDTARTWKHDTYTIGGNGDGGSGTYDAMTVAEALSSVGDENVWVCGYIVGGDLSSSSASFDKPFDSKTNILLGPRPSTSDKDACLSVQLLSGGIRDALNLVDNPELLGRKVCLKGNIVESYFGIPGIKYITDYELL